MYEIERSQDAVTVRRGKYLVYTAKPESFIVYRKTSDGETEVGKVADLSDTELLMALANAVEIKEFSKDRSGL